MKTNQVPDHIKMIIQKNMSGQGQTDNGMMIGSSNTSTNVMFNQQGTMGNTNNAMGMGGSNNNLFGNNAQRGWPSIGGGATNNMFSNNNNSMNTSGNNLFSIGGLQGKKISNPALSIAMQSVVFENIKTPTSLIIFEYYKLIIYKNFL